MVTSTPLETLELNVMADIENAGPVTIKLLLGTTRADYWRGVYNMTPIRCDTRQGRFYPMEDGTEYVSVTTFLQAINKPALVQWAAKEERLMTMQAAADLYEDLHGTPKMSRPTYITTLDARIGKTKAHTKLMAKASEIGKQAHALIEWNLRRSLGQEAGPEPKIGDKALWAFMAYEEWAKSVSLKPILIEQKVYSRTHEYAGTMDLLAEINGVLTLVDWKTSKAVFGEAHLQNVAYQVALAEMGYHKAAAGLILRLPKTESDSNFEAVPVGPVEELLPVVLATKRIWEWWYAEEQASRAKWEAAQHAKKETVAA